MPKRSRPTLNEVALAAGVSVASASRALSGASASPEMVERVRAAAVALGYVADAMARSLKVRRTEQLALAVADLANPVYVTMMRAIESVVSAAGYRLVVTATGTDADNEIATIRGMSRGYADGLIISPLRITPAVIDELLSASVPVVVIGTIPPSVALDNVRANSMRGIRLAHAHLVAGGRASIAFVNGPINTTPGDARLRGFRRATEAAAGQGRRARDRLGRRLHRRRRRKGDARAARSLRARRADLRERSAGHRRHACAPAGGKVGSGRMSRSSAWTTPNSPTSRRRR